MNWIYPHQILLRNVQKKAIIYLFNIIWRVLKTKYKKNQNIKKKLKMSIQNNKKL